MNYCSSELEWYKQNTQLLHTKDIIQKYDIQF